MSDGRNAEPMPNAIVSSVFESGRRMSGRIGMSFASTVSRVIDVPVTHSCFDPLIVPAWTDAISSSVAPTIVPPARSIRATLGSMNRRPPTSATTTTRPRRRRRPPRS